MTTTRQTMEQGAALAPAESTEVKALAVQPAPASPLDLPAEVFRSGLERRKANRAALMEWIRSSQGQGRALRAGAHRGRAGMGG